MFIVGGLVRRALRQGRSPRSGRRAFSPGRVREPWVPCDRRKARVAGDSATPFDRVPSVARYAGSQSRSDSVYPRLRGLALGYTLLPTPWASPLRGLAHSVRGGEKAPPLLIRYVHSWTQRISR